MTLFRKLMLRLLPLVASLLALSPIAQAQVQGTPVVFEGNFSSNDSLTGHGLQLYYGSRPTVSVDLVTNNFTWAFQAGKEVAVKGMWTKIDGNLRLIAEDIYPIQYLKGTLESAFGIGGESTGFALRMENGRKVEIDLKTNNWTKEFIPGRAVILRGYYKTIRAVETVRVVLVVNWVYPAS